MFTYAWQDLIDVTSKFVKGNPLATALGVQISDLVSGEMYTRYPWKDTIVTSAAGAIPLINGQQDHSANAPNISRLFKAAIWNLTATPFDVRDLSVRDDLAVDLFPRSYTTMRACSLQQGVGLFRLDGAINVPSGMQLELRVDYQIEPIRIVSLTQALWFRDKYFRVALEGCLYWAYKLNDDARFADQRKIFDFALDRMTRDEDYGPTMQVFPGDAMGLGRDQNALNIFGW